MNTNLRQVAILLLSCSSLTSFAVNYSKNEIIDLLDQTIANRSEYQAQKEQRIDDLRRLLKITDPTAKVRISNQICHEYWGYNTDSARYYAKLWLDMAADPHWGNAEELQHANIYKARCMAMNGLYEEAKQTLYPIESTLAEDNRYDYWNAKSEIYSWEAEFSPLPNAYQDAYPKIMSCYDSILTCKGIAPEMFKHLQSLTIFPDWKLRNEMILPILDTISIDNKNLRYIANNVANNYLLSEQRDSAIYYFALSAISDLRQSVREQSSLSELAVMLYQEGDVMRAYTYITTCFEDAKLCGAQMRTVTMAREMPLIIQAYHEHVGSQRNWLINGLVALAILLIVILVVLYRFIRARKRLSDAHRKLLKYQDELKQSKRQLEQANEKLKASNLSLHESNLIKQTYVASYMKHCSDTIAKIENYRLMLQKTALNSNYGKLVSTIKETNVIDKELEDFYLSFDETFLGLFPTFISDFNALLRPEDQITVPEDNRLSTELRIFALIRLGINDSEDIANFLRYSIKTIYNYRTRIRSKAIGVRNELETELMKIGSETV